MQVSTNETFAEFRKAAKEKAEKERGLKEQQVSQSSTLYGMPLQLWADGSSKNNGFTRNFHENKYKIFNTLVKEMARQLKERSERERQRVEQVSKF